MKKIEAIIRPDKVDEVKEALILLGHAGLTVIEVKGHGIHMGISQQWRGQQYRIDLLPKVMIIAVVHDHEVSDCIDVISRAAKTGMIGDGKIFVTAVEEVVRIRTGEKGVQAI